MDDVYLLVGVHYKCFRLIFGNIIIKPEKMKKIIQLILIIAITTGVTACNLQNQKSGLTVTKVTRSKVDAALTIEGRWGTYINGKSYQQMPLDTYKGWQYVTYYNQQRQLCLARRKLSKGAWQIIHFDDYVFEGNDNHNVTVLGICRKDGTIHLAYDHHNDPLHYRVSQLGVANNPEAIKWSKNLFSDTRDWLKKGKPITRLTYPIFIQTPEGNLLFISRIGIPIDGQVRLSIYDPDKNGWSDSWNVTSQNGVYTFEGKTSKSRYAYLNGVHYGPSGRLHISWCWREDMGSVFRNVNYAYSDDNGQHWFNSAGQKIAGPGELISTDSPGIKVWDVTPHQGQEVMMGQYVDGLDRPHIVISRLRDGEAPLPLGKRDESKSAYYHYWRDDKGMWHQNEIYFPIGGGADSERNRAKILATPDNDLIVMFNNKAKIVLMSATAENQYRDWKMIHEEEGPWDGEPLPDLSRWREEGILSIYMQKNPSKDGEPTDLYVVDFSISVTGKNK